MVLANLLVLLAVAAMMLGMTLIIIPAMPVTALQWAITMVYAALSIALTGETRLTLPAALVATGFMAVGSTSSLWMPFFGLQGRRISCWGLLAFFIGMAVGSVIIPIPFIGTVIGGVAGVFIVEYASVRRLREAMRGGQAALQLIALAMVAEIVFSTAIILTFLVSVWTTR